MKINKAELIKLGTPKPKPRKHTKPQKVIIFLKSGEMPEKQLEAAINGYGHFAEIMRSLKAQKLVKSRLCPHCKETTLFSLT